MSSDGVGRWGGEPLVWSGAQEINAPAAQQESFEAVVHVPGRTRTAASRIFGVDGGARRMLVTRLLADGLSASTGARRVVVGSLWGGTGTSTLTAAVGAAWRAKGVGSVLADATSHRTSGLLERVSLTSRIAAVRWSDISMVRIPEGFRHLATQAEARSVVISGEVSNWTVVPPIVEGASQSWPLLLVDAGGADVRIARALTATRPHLVVLSCRHDVSELTETAEFVRELVAQRLVDGSECVIVSQGPAETWSRQVAAAMRAGADVVGGAVRVDFERSLWDRVEAVDGPGSDGVRAVAASVSASLG